MNIVLNAGIGDLLLSHAMLYGVDCAVSLSRPAVLRARDVCYLPFAIRLMTLLFGDRAVSVAEAPGIDPIALLSAGFPARRPSLASVLPAGEPLVTGPYVAVTTKVRGLDRSRYEAMRPRLVSSLQSIAAVVTVVLVGEREVGENAEYRHHGKNRIYSIYEDLQQVPHIDLTVPELGHTPPSWDQFGLDCLHMRDAIGVVALGSGGNLTMALAVGRPVGFYAGTEMAEYLQWMPLEHDERGFFRKLEALA